MSKRKEELEKRKLMSPFPLEVFHPSIRPFLDSLHREYDIPRSYIGLSMLSAYSSAVGSAYHVRINKLGDMYFPVWACLEGISSFKSFKPSRNHLSLESKQPLKINTYEKHVTGHFDKLSDQKTVGRTPHPLPNRNGQCHPDRQKDADEEDKRIY